VDPLWLLRPASLGGTLHACLLHHYIWENESDLINEHP
jgi:hypothetical protein